MITKRPYPDHAKVFWQTAQTVDGAIDAAAQEDPTEELARLAEFLPTLCWIGYGDGSLFWYNRRWHDYCGSTPEEMAGWGWQSVHDPAYLPEVVRRWSAAIAAGSPFEMTFPLRGADGQFRPFLTRVVPIRNRAGTIVRWLGTNTEISEQIKAERALEISEATYEVLTNAMPQMVWSTLPDGYHDYYNVKWYEFTGVPPGSTDGDGWSGIFHADDQPRAWDRWRHSLSTGEDYEIEYRLRHHSGKYRWVLGRAQPVRSDQGVITRWIGTCTDIDDAKRAAEQNELLSRELSHRIKNIFAVISGLISLTANRAAEARPALSTLLGRIAALGRAHEFARPHSPQSMPSMAEGTFTGLLTQLLSPYEEAGIGRVSITGDDIRIDDRSATPLALVIHELATNSAKYGALSAPGGQLSIAIERSADTLVIVWTEAGGPQVNGPPTRTGFGTELAELSIKRQLGGLIEKDWRPQGLQVRIGLDPGRLHREL
ncbi:MAG: PAS domain-containing protein [Novosphingobium sp.]|nr:PAS domain-containing protein [Novosphingobium sp.]